MSSPSKLFVNGRLSIKALSFHFPFRHTSVCVCVVWCVVNRVRSQGFSWRYKAWLLILFPWNIHWQMATCWSNYPFNLPLCTGPSNVFSSLPFRDMYSFKIWRPWIAVLAIVAGVVQWRYKDWNRPQIPWHFTGYSLTLLEFPLAYLNQTNSVPKTIIYTCIFLVSKNAIWPRINQIKFSKIFSIFTSQFAAHFIVKLYWRIQFHDSYRSIQLWKTIYS